MKLRDQHGLWTGLALALTALAASCVDPSTLECYGNLCPRGTVCVPELESCVDQERVQACTGAGLVDGDPCQAGTQPGVCASGVCGAGCGDGVRLEDEVCDGADFGALSCLDFDFYTGALDCASGCAGVSTERCAGYCGDGLVNGPELCDTSLESSVSCSIGGYSFGGPPDCQLACTEPFGDCGLTGLGRIPGHIPPGDVNDLEALSRGHLLMTSLRGTIFEALGARFQLIATPAVGDLYGLWVLDQDQDQDQAWAVSDAGEIIHLRDGTWNLESGVPAIAELRDIDGLGADRIWAVGMQRVLHFDGTSWQDVPIADPDSDPDTPWTEDLSKVVAVDGPNGVQLWLGSDNATGAAPPLHVLENGVLTSFDYPFQLIGGIYPASPTDVYVAMRSAIGFIEGKLVHFHYDGSWSATELDLGIPGQAWHSVTGTGPNNIYASSYAFSIDHLFVGRDPFHAQLWRFDGSDWQLIDDYGPDAINLSAIGGSIYAKEVDFARSRPELRRFDGTSWIRHSRGAALETRTGSEFCAALQPADPFDCGLFTSNPGCADVCEPSSAAYATGAAILGPGHLIVTSSAVDTEDPIVEIPFLWDFETEAGWTPLAFPGGGSGVPLHHAYTPDRGQNVFAVGDQGVALVRDNAGSWTRFDTPGGKDLREVHGLSSDDMYAVGDGTILHFDGSSWTEVFDAGSTMLTGVWVGSDAVAVAVGSGCTVLTNRSGSWQAMAPPPPCEASGDLTGVYANGPDEIRVTESGSKHVQVHSYYGGTEWTDLSFDFTGRGSFTDFMSVGDVVITVGYPVTFRGKQEQGWLETPDEFGGFSSASGGITGTARNVYMVQTDGFVWELLRLWPWTCDATETQCGDGMDNDCDGQFDTDDSDCPTP